jgi:S1-C subfamily serine protease
VIFTSDGEMAGVARFGQFLTGSSCRLIADQIIRHGSVKRATLGVIISEIPVGDSIRQQIPGLGMRAAMRIDQVIAGSAAEKAALKPGDLVVALAGEAVSDIPSFAAAIAAKTGRTELQVFRDGQLLHVSVELQPK